MYCVQLFFDGVDGEATKSGTLAPIATISSFSTTNYLLIRRKIHPQRLQKIDSIIEVPIKLALITYAYMGSKKKG